jgi:MoaA/NifB/PqqE/SkfB family radical SAM enzyme
MCARYFIDGELIKDKVNSMHTSLDFIKDKIGIKIIKQLNRFTSCGNFGDGAMNPECVEIYSWVRQVNSRAVLILHSNGGARNKEFWQDLAKLDVRVTFAIDGLEDTNHMYRRNVKWNKLMENVESYLEAGGRATWEMLIFKHNEHQVDKCRELSQQLGFKNFNSKQSARWSDFDSDGVWRDLDTIKSGEYVLEKSTMLKAPDIGEGGNSQKVQIDKDNVNRKKIKCYAHQVDKDFVEIYLAVNGDVSPCCWLGDLKMHESKNIIKDYTKVNLHHSTLEEILDSEYFHELDKGIRGEKNSYRLHTCYFTCGVK